MDKYAWKYDKYDLDRLGLFSEMPYLRPELIKKKRRVASYRKPIICSGPKTKSGTQDGYFDHTFKRLFIGDGRPVKAHTRNNIKKPFVPTGPGKKHSSPGDFFGCFSKKIQYFSSQCKQDKQDNHPNRYFIVNPGKKGGPGYVDITISKYPGHLRMSYIIKKVPKVIFKPFYLGSRKKYFDSNPFKYSDSKNLRYNPVKETKTKFTGRIFLPAGPYRKNYGYFNPWPTHMPDPYLPEKKTKIYSISDKPFRPTHIMPKTMYTNATLYTYTNKINQKNWNTIVPEYLKYL